MAERMATVLLNGLIEALIILALILVTASMSIASHLRYMRDQQKH